MNTIDKILKFIGINKVEQTVIPQDTVQLNDDTKEYPLEGGQRRSIPESNGIAGILEGLNLERIENEIRQEVYRLLDNLAVYDPDVSKAIENIVELANKPITIEILDETYTDETKADIISEILENTKNWYDNSSGLDALKGDLIAQIVRTGALSAEIIPNNSLTGIKEIVLVPTRSIVFRYDTEYDCYFPYQDSNRLNSSVAMAYNTGGLIELNPLTYSYSAIRKIDDNPYGIPPIISALQNIAKESKMFGGVDKIVDRFGLLGFLTIGVTPPRQKQGETDLAYKNRTQQYLKDLAPSIDKGIDKGYVLGFTGHHEFNLAANNVNASGFKDLFQLNTELKHSGLKQNPFLLGRNFSTTEAMANVIFEQLVASIESYQMKIDNFLAKVIKLEAMLMGYSINNIKVKSDKPKLKDEIKAHLVTQQKILNARMLYDDGIISQTQRAVMLGYNEPDLDAPRSISMNDSNQPQVDQDEVEEESNKKLIFDYGHTHSTMTEQLASLRNTRHGRLMKKYIELYLADSMSAYGEAIDEVVEAIADKLISLTENADEQQIIDAVIYEIKTRWEDSYTNKQKAVTAKWVNDAYTAFRMDREMFKGLKEVTKATFNTLDFRAINFYADSDTFYLGKFINDSDTNKKLTQYIKDNYLANDFQIGRNSEALDKFRSEFTDLLQGEDYKIERIISTTVNKMRNTASINSMWEAGVEQFEIRGVNDRLQCIYCKGMQGKQFSVTKQRDTIQNQLTGDPTKVELVPFLTSTIKKTTEETQEDFLDRIKKTDSSFFENNSVALPPYHPFCRDVAIAII